MSAAIAITDASFEAEVLKASKPVLAYFWASWCGPCRLMSPSIDWAAETYSDRLKIVKLEVDPNPETVARYSVRGIPALVLFQNGEVVATHEGAITRPQLTEFLDTHLASIL
jgi:thioredoxin 1